MSNQFGGQPIPRGVSAASAAEVQAALQDAVALHQRGQLLEAEQIYRNILKVLPDHFDATRLLGIVLLRRHQLVEAEQLIGRALKINPNDPSVLNSRGNVLQELKRFDEALASYDRAIVLKPDYAAAFYNRGDALRKLKRFEEAIASYDKAIGLKRDYAEAFNNRGNAFCELKRLDEALASYDEAIALKPNHAEAFNNRGMVLQDLTRFDEALASYEKAITLKPDYAAAFCNRGNVLRELKRLDEALASYDKAIAVKPNYAEAFNNKGITLQDLKRPDEAVTTYEMAIALKPDYAAAFCNRGNVLRELKRFDEALASYDKAITLGPDDAEAHTNLASAFSEQGRRTEAVRHYELAVMLKPDHSVAKLALCMAQLPILYSDEAEITERRAAYQECLEALCDDVEQRKIACDWAKAIGSSQPFFLTYQGYNDRDLQSLYGSLVCRIMAERYPPAALSPPPCADEPVRLGIVSGFFRQHSNWKIPIWGWLSQIDRRRFRIFGYHTGVEEDAATKHAVALCDRFVQGPLSIERWRQTILDDAPHVLIYPEVGMDPVSIQLAAQRLAPVQCNSWGHPDTSGFPTLDYFLSSELMEPPEARDHYTEHLVRLPNLSVYYEPPDQQWVALNRMELGLRSTATIYWCGQSLYKYLPQFDQVFPRIAREVGDCQFVFIQYRSGTYLNQLFSQRLDKAFSALGLKATEHCIFLPFLDGSRFVAAIGLCDIVLDSIGWSGCNSTLESLHHGLPIVTMTAPLMRGRHSMAILKMMGVEETVTETLDDYVATAIRLARDVSWRMAVRARIAENKHKLYRDTACISALQEFLDGVARHGANKWSLATRADGALSNSQTPANFLRLQPLMPPP